MGPARSRRRIPHLFLVLTLLLVLPLSSLGSRPRPHILKKRNPSFSPLSQTSPSFSQLVELSNLDRNLDFNDGESFLSKVLIPRPVGSKNLTKVQGLFVERFTKLGWHVEKDSFTATTPRGVESFTNLIFTHDPLAIRKFVLSAHLDSKISPVGFVGATDSAVPCALLFDLAESLTPWLNQRKQRVNDNGGEEEEGFHSQQQQSETLTIVLFDGEEAFEEWTSSDSIYGAKHLVNKWENTLITPSTRGGGGIPSATMVNPKNELERVSHLVLLDLLGSRNPVIRNFYQNTGWLFDEFLHSEMKLGKAGLLWPNSRGSRYEEISKKLGAKEKSFFIDRKGPQGWMGTIEDDHLPFLRKGVPVVHLISVPFPRVWHTLADDASALDLDTIKAWALIIRLTVAEYLGLDPLLNDNASSSKRDELMFESSRTDDICSTTKGGELLTDT